MLQFKSIKGLLSGNDRSAQVRKNVVGSFIVRGISIAASFFLVPLTIGYVSSELYGVWLTLSSIMTWLQFMDIGFSQGMKNKVTEAIAKNEWADAQSFVSTTYFMMVLIFIPLCIILEFLIPHIDWSSLLNVNIIYNAEIIKTVQVLIIFFCISMILNVLSSLVAAFQQVALSNAFNAIGQVLALIAIIFCVHFVKPSLVVLVFAISAMPVIVTFISSIILFNGRYKKVAPKISCIRFTKIKELFSLGYKFFIINIQVVVLYQSTNFLISYLSSPLQVTAYNIAYKYLNLAMMISIMIFAPLWPAYTDAYTKGDYDWMKRIWTKMYKVYGITVITCIIMVAISPLVYHLWIGNRANIPFTMTCLVGLYVMAYCCMNLNGTLIVGIGKIKLDTIVVCIGMCVHIPLSFFLGHFIGAYGVVVSMILINSFYAFIYHVQVKKILSGTATGIWNE